MSPLAVEEKEKETVHSDDGDFFFVGQVALSIDTDRCEHQHRHRSQPNAAAAAWQPCQLEFEWMSSQKPWKSTVMSDAAPRTVREESQLFINV